MHRELQVAVSIGEVHRIAQLARLRLEDDEAAALARDMSSILEHMKALAGAGPEELVSPGGPNHGEGAEALSEGQAGRRLGAPEPDPLALSPKDIAPDWRHGFFVVPRLPAVEGRSGEDSAAKGPSDSESG